MTDMKRETDNRPVSTDCIGILRALVEHSSEREAAAIVGVARATLGRILASLPVTPAVAFMVETKLRERSAGAAS
jgi:hypothetical protein